MKRQSRVGRESYGCSEQIQELLIKALEKRPTVLKNGKKKSDELLVPKRTSVIKQTNCSEGNSNNSYVSLSC